MEQIFKHQQYLEAIKEFWSLWELDIQQTMSPENIQKFSELADMIETYEKQNYPLLLVNEEVPVIIEDEDEWDTMVFSNLSEMELSENDLQDLNDLDLFKKDFLDYHKKLNDLSASITDLFNQVELCSVDDEKYFLLQLLQNEIDQYNNCLVHSISKNMNCFLFLEDKINGLIS